MTEAYYVSLGQALRKGVAAVSGDLAVLTDQILTALNHPGDTTFEIERWARQVAAEQDALNQLDLLPQTDDELASGECGEQPAVLAYDEVDEGCYSAIQRGTRLGNVSLPNSAHSRFRCSCAPRHSRSAIRSWSGTSCRSVASCRYSRASSW